MNTVQFSKKNLTFLMCLLFSITVFYFALNGLIYGARRILNRKVNKNNDEVKRWIEDFRKMGQKSEKVGVHRYEDMYGAYLGPLRGKELSLLEIGLGCESGVKPGTSLFLWQEYLPNAKISVLEVDKACADGFRDKVEQLYVGDQADMDFLRSVVESTSHYYDVIIDDGGHTRKQQISSLLGLWSLVKPDGGVYIVEDTYHSFLNGSNDHVESVFDYVTKLIYLFNEDGEKVAQKTAARVGSQQNEQFLNPLEFGEEISASIREFAKDLSNVNCYYHACVFVKKFAS